MTVEHRAWPYVLNDGSIVQSLVADLEADLPNGLPAGSRAFTKDTNKEWVVNAGGTWQELAGSPGAPGEHPDLAAHNTLGLATQAELDAAGGVTQQPAIADVNRAGNAATQTLNLQNKVDEVIAALRAAGVISS